MAGARATWKGVLQISLVTIPIKVYPATEASTGIAFNQLHEQCQSRVQQKKWCPRCAREVPSAEIVKGFEFAKDQYVLLLEAELDAVQPPSTRVIDLTQVADAQALDPTAIDRSYYLAPDGPDAAEAFSVVTTALRDRVAIGKLAIYGREYLVAVRPTKAPPARRYVLMLHTLHHAAERRSPEEDWQAGAAPIAQVTLAQQLLAALKVETLSLADFTDAYRDGVRSIIAAKIAGDEIVQAPPIASVPVASPQEALVQSLAAVRGGKKTPAKAAVLPKRKRA